MRWKIRHAGSLPAWSEGEGALVVNSDSGTARQSPSGRLPCKQGGVPDWDKGDRPLYLFILKIAGWSCSGAVVTGATKAVEERYLPRKKGTDPLSSVVLPIKRI